MRRVRLTHPDLVADPADPPAFGARRDRIGPRVGAPAVTVYPDSGKVGVYTSDGADDVIVRRESGVGYYEGEPGPR